MIGKLVGLLNSVAAYQVKSNPYHKPAGPGGGQFTSGAGNGATTKLEDYQGSHQAPRHDPDGFNRTPTNGMVGELFPDDVLEHPQWYGGLPKKPDIPDAMFDPKQETVTQLRNVVNGVTDKVTIYRAMPKDADGAIRDGDWVALSQAYAHAHGEMNMGGKPYQIVKQQVPANHIYNNGDSLEEWGYDSKSLNRLMQAIKSYWCETKTAIHPQCEGQGRCILRGIGLAPNIELHDHANKLGVNDDPVKVEKPVITGGKDIAASRLTDEEIVNAVDKIRADNKRLKLLASNDDKIVRKIWEDAGFGSASVVPAATYDKLTTSEVFHGVEGATLDEAQTRASTHLTDPTNETYISHGIVGDGIYFSSSESAASGYAHLSVGTKGVVVSAKLALDTKLIEREDARIIQEKVHWYTGKRPTYSNIATELGYDGIRAPQPNGYVNVVIQNRSKLITTNPDGKEVK